MDPSLIVRNALRAMGDEPPDPGPSNLEDALLQAASRYGSQLAGQELRTLVADTFSDDDNEFRRMLAQYVQRWDIQNDVAWAAGAAPSTRQRRERILEL